MPYSPSIVGGVGLPECHRLQKPCGGPPAPPSFGPAAVKVDLGCVTCYLCGQFGHWYSSCKRFDRATVVFQRLSDSAYHCMRHDDWIGTATMRECYRFIAIVTGLHFGSYLLSIHQQQVPGNKAMRCCDVGCLPGALVMIHDTIHIMQAPQVFQHPVQSSATVARAYLGSSHLPLSDPKDVTSAEPHGTTSVVDETAVEPTDEANATSDDDDSCAVEDGIARGLHHQMECNVSQITTASTGLLRSVDSAVVKAAQAATQAEAATAMEANMSVASTSTMLSAPTPLPPHWADASLSTAAAPSVDTSCTCNAVLSPALAPVPTRSTATTTAQENTVEVEVEGGVDAAKEKPRRRHEEGGDLRFQQTMTKVRGHISSLQADARHDKEIRRITANLTKRGVSFNTVYFKFIPLHFTYSQMRTLFDAVGEVRRVRLALPANLSSSLKEKAAAASRVSKSSDKNSKTSTTQSFVVAFVEYAEPTDVAKAMHYLDHMAIDGYFLSVKPGKSSIKGVSPQDASSDSGSNNSPSCTFGMLDKDNTSVSTDLSGVSLFKSFNNNNSTTVALSTTDVVETTITTDTDKQKVPVTNDGGNAAERVPASTGAETASSPPHPQQQRDWLAILTNRVSTHPSVPASSPTSELFIIKSSPVISVALRRSLLDEDDMDNNAEATADAHRSNPQLQQSKKQPVMTVLKSFAANAADYAKFRTNACSHRCLDNIYALQAALADGDAAATATVKKSSNDSSPSLQQPVEVCDALKKIMQLVPAAEVRKVSSQNSEYVLVDTVMSTRRNIESQLASHELFLFRICVELLEAIPVKAKKSSAGAGLPPLRVTHPELNDLVMEMGERLLELAQVVSAARHPTRFANAVSCSILSVGLALACVLEPLDDHVSTGLVRRLIRVSLRLNTPRWMLSALKDLKDLLMKGSETQKGQMLGKLVPLLGLCDSPAQQCACTSVACKCDSTTRWVRAHSMAAFLLGHGPFVCATEESTSLSTPRIEAVWKLFSDGAHRGVD